MTARVLLWAASGPRIGMGHVVRTSAVALAVRALGGEPQVLVEDPASRDAVRARGLACDLAPDLGLDAAGASLAPAPAPPPDVERRLAALGSPAAAWLDGFRDWSPVVRALRARGARTALVETRGPAREEADLVVHPALHFEPDAWERARPDRVRGGPPWIPLRPEVEREPRRAERAVDLLVTFGGSDPLRSTEAVLDALRELRYGGRVAATLGVHMGARADDLRARAARLPRGELVDGARDLASWIADSRLAVTALGTTLYELAHLGTRALVLANYEQDRAALAFYGAHGPHRPLGLAGELGGPALARALAEGLAALAELPPPRVPDLGPGARRCAAELLAARPARPGSLR